MTTTKWVVTGIVIWAALMMFALAVVSMNNIEDEEDINPKE